MLADLHEFQSQPPILAKFYIGCFLQNLMEEHSIPLHIINFLWDLGLCNSNKVLQKILWFAISDILHSFMVTKPYRRYRIVNNLYSIISYYIPVLGHSELEGTGFRLIPEIIFRGGQGLHARIPAPWSRCNKPWPNRWKKMMVWIGNNPKQAQWSEGLFGHLPRSIGDG